MASRAARGLKSKWSKMSAECFETLTFGELRVGDKFIGLPWPGDNSGHGGFRGRSLLFVKIKRCLPDEQSIGNVLRFIDWELCSFSESEEVIKVLD